MSCLELLGSRSDSLQLTGCRNRIAMLSNAFQVKLNRLADEVLHFVQCFAGSAETRQIGSVCAPSRIRFFVDDEVFHLSPACLRIATCRTQPAVAVTSPKPTLRALFPSASASGTIPLF